jgi:hypothetical protein
VIDDRLARKSPPAEAVSQAKALQPTRMAHEDTRTRAARHKAREGTVKCASPPLTRPNDLVEHQTRIPGGAAAPRKEADKDRTRGETRKCKKRKSSTFRRKSEKEARITRIMNNLRHHWENERWRIGKVLRVRAGKDGELKTQLVTGDGSRLLFRSRLTDSDDF